MMLAFILKRYQRCCKRRCTLKGIVTVVSLPGEQSHQINELFSFYVPETTKIKPWSISTWLPSSITCFLKDFTINVYLRKLLVSLQLVVSLFPPMRSFLLLVLQDMIELDFLKIQSWTEAKIILGIITMYLLFQGFQQAVVSCCHGDSFCLLPGLSRLASIFCGSCCQAG